MNTAVPQKAPVFSAMLLGVNAKIIGGKSRTFCEEGAALPVCFHSFGVQCSGRPSSIKSRFLLLIGAGRGIPPALFV